MTLDAHDILNSILSSLGRVDHIKPEDIPNIDLYMDQVTTFMEKQLASTKRYPDDKVLTKTMINNYAKNDLIPPPDKKKYSKEHVLLLIFIYYFKNILSISDIDKLLGPISDRYFNERINTLNLQGIYEEVFSLEQDEVNVLAKDIVRKFNISQESFKDIEGVNGEHLRYFTFICMLSFDVYIKKMMIEKLIDLLPDHEPDRRKRKK